MERIENIEKTKNKIKVKWKNIGKLSSDLKKRGAIKNIIEKS